MSKTAASRLAPPSRSHPVAHNVGRLDDGLPLSAAQEVARRVGLLEPCDNVWI